MSPPSPQSGLTLYVAYHDERPHLIGDLGPYVPLCNVGPGGERPAGFSCYDDDGGWPQKNDAYCELSALRHLLTHARTPYLGLSHYRRLFTTRRWRRTYTRDTYDVRTWDWAHLDRYGATGTQLLAAIGGRDWCTAPVVDVRWAGHANLWDQFCAYHPASQLEVADEVLRRVAPNWPSFRSYLRTSVQLRPYNMMLARRPLLAVYTDWLWPVLEACEQQIGHPAGSYGRRWPGFLAERLHGYYLQVVGATQGWTVGEVPIAIVDAAGITNSRSAAPQGAGAARPPVGAQGWHGLVRAVPFPLRVAVGRVARARPGSGSRGSRRKAVREQG